MKIMFKPMWPVMAAVVALLSGCGKNEEGPQTPPAPQFLIVDFEQADDYLAGSTAAGENLYSASGNDQYLGYYDTASDLVMNINEAGGSFEFWNGGVAISQWNNMTMSDYTNQCSVYYSDPATGFGGHNGSKTFALHNGYEGDYTAPSEILFLNDDTERTFDHFWVCNSTYAFLVMRDGNSSARQLDAAHQDYFRLTVKGFDKAGVQTGTVTYYLADFRAATSPGLVTGWQKVDLRPLGAVHRLQMLVEGSDVDTSGLNTPAYFCFDDIAIVK
ncbi:MAG: DUF4465 domain-containing protein [Rikenellaceae bacterium]|jgi:hypothetical protein|nr:DUF4465 domain-containing protein [Rikenellaceae bacterium]